MATGRCLTGRNSMIASTVDAVRDGSFSGWTPSRLRTFVSDLRSVIPQVPVTLHPLGFVHFELTHLLAVQNGERVRVHLWDPRLSPQDEAGGIHDHTWALQSAVLHGRIRNSNYRPTPDPEGPYSGSMVSYSQTNTFTAVGNYRLEQLSEVVVHAGETYQIPSRIVHTSELLTSQALTLVVAQPDDQAATVGPLLLLPNGETPSGTEQRTTLAKPDAELLLAQFSATL